MYFENNDSEEIRNFCNLELGAKILDVAESCINEGLSIEESIELVAEQDSENKTLFKECLKFEMEMIIYGYSFN